MRNGRELLNRIRINDIYDVYELREQGVMNMPSLVGWVIPRRRETGCPLFQWRVNFIHINYNEGNPDSCTLHVRNGVQLLPQVPKVGNICREVFKSLFCLWNHSFFWQGKCWLHKELFTRWHRKDQFQIEFDTLFHAFFFVGLKKQLCSASLATHTWLWRVQRSSHGYYVHKMWTCDVWEHGATSRRHTASRGHLERNTKD